MECDDSISVKHGEKSKKKITRKTKVKDIKQSDITQIGHDELKINLGSGRYLYRKDVSQLIDDKENDK